MLVTRNFPPLVGGMENVNQQVLRALGADFQVALCGPIGSSKHAESAMLVQEVPVQRLLRFVVEMSWSALKVSWQVRPKVVVAGSGLSAPMAWLAARVSGAKLVVYLHGLDIIAPSLVYQTIWLPFIRACDLVLVNSRNTAELAIAGRISPARIRVLHPGTEIPVLDPQAGLDFRENFGLGERPLLLSVGRLTQRKGLVEFVSNCLPGILVQNPQALLLIIGAEASDALHTRSGSEVDRITSAARELGILKSVRFIGRCDERVLSAAYQAAQVHVFPVLAKRGDVEGFGMVALEAAAHGLQSVAFDVGGVGDAVDGTCSGKLIEAGRYDDFQAAVNELLSTGGCQVKLNDCLAFAANKSWVVFAKRIRQFVSDVVNGKIDE